MRAAVGDIFGWGVVYALHARACIERGRLWQAEHCICAVRDRALSLACIRKALPAGEGRGYDDLPADILAAFERTHVTALMPEQLRVALAASVRALMREGKEAVLPVAEETARRVEEIAT
jgi:hypothetical protein